MPIFTHLCIYMHSLRHLSAGDALSEIPSRFGKNAIWPRCLHTRAHAQTLACQQRCSLHSPSRLQSRSLLEAQVSSEVRVNNSGGSSPSLSEGSSPAPSCSLLFGDIAPGSVVLLQDGNRHQKKEKRKKHEGSGVEKCASEI